MKALSFQVIGVDIAHRRISLSNGDCLPYSKLVLALGGAPRRLTVPGADLKVCLLMHGMLVWRILERHSSNRSGSHFASEYPYESTSTACLN